MISRELKKDARIKLSGNYIKSVIISLIYLAFIYAFTKLSDYITNEVAQTIYEIVFLIFSLPLSFGLTTSIVKISRNEDVSYTDFINIGFQNIFKIWRVFGRILLRFLVPIIFLIVSIGTFLYSLYTSVLNNTTETSNGLFLASLVVMSIIAIFIFIKALYYCLSFYIINDHPEMSGTEVLNEGKKLMKGNLLNYIGLNISFFGWYLLIYVISILTYYLTAKIELVSIVIEICSFILFPYTTATVLEFYEELRENNK